MKLFKILENFLKGMVLLGSTDSENKAHFAYIIDQMAQ